MKKVCLHVKIGLDEQKIFMRYQKMQGYMVIPGVVIHYGVVGEKDKPNWNISHKHGLSIKKFYPRTITRKGVVAWVKKNIAHLDWDRSVEALMRDKNYKEYSDARYL